MNNGIINSDDKLNALRLSRTLDEANIELNNALIDKDVRIESLIIYGQDVFKAAKELSDLMNGMERFYFGTMRSKWKS